MIHPTLAKFFHFVAGNEKSINFFFLGAFISIASQACMLSVIAAFLPEMENDSFISIPIPASFKPLFYSKIKGLVFEELADNITIATFSVAAAKESLEHMFMKLISSLVWLVVLWLVVLPRFFSVLRIFFQPTQD